MKEDIINAKYFIDINGEDTEVGYDETKGVWYTEQIYCNNMLIERILYNNKGKIDTAEIFLYDSKGLLLYQIDWEIGRQTHIYKFRNGRKKKRRLGFTYGQKV
ncbi:MAG: hypothetical protein ACYC2T_15030 [Bacillota bacterium]